MAKYSIPTYYDGKPMSHMLGKAVAYNTANRGVACAQCVCDEAALSIDIRSDYRVVSHSLVDGFHCDNCDRDLS